MGRIKKNLKPRKTFAFVIDGQTTKFYPDCGSAEKTLKTHLPDYQKSRKYFTRRGNDIYLKLKKHLATAVKNSQSLNKFDPFNPDCASCEADLFFLSEDIRHIIQP